MRAMVQSSAPPEKHIFIFICILIKNSGRIRKKLVIVTLCMLMGSGRVVGNMWIEPGIEEEDVLLLYVVLYVYI